MTNIGRQIWCFFFFVIAVNIFLGYVAAQTTCKNGLGRVLYERLPNQQLQGYDDEVVRDTAPPFRVLEKCQDLCLRDRTSTNNLVRTCTSFDFQPGSRITSFGTNTEYEESLCYLTSEQTAPEGIGSLMLVPNSVHFNEVCLTSSRTERECPSRRYVFERHPRRKLKLPISDIKEITAANRSDCQDKCLNEFSFVCRSANFDSTLRSCALTRFTRRTHPELMEDDPNSDYLENTCLNAERRCDGLAVFVKEENKRLGGPFEVDIFNNITLEECQTMCLRAEKYFCRSVEFDGQTKQCMLSEEDSVSQKDDISISSSPSHHFYDLVCLDNQRITDYPQNSVTSHLFSGGRRPDTAFQRYRNSRLGGEFHSEITGRSLSECRDECLRQTSFQCRSAVYSDRFRTCRLSRYNQRDSMRIIYDADYDYYENLMLNVVRGNDGNANIAAPDRLGQRPSDHSGGEWRPNSKDENMYGADGTGNRDNQYGANYHLKKLDGGYPWTPHNNAPIPAMHSGDRYPQDNSFTDRRFRPSSHDTRYPPSLRFYGSDRHFVPNEIINGAKRSNPDSAKGNSMVPLRTSASVRNYPPYKYASPYGGTMQSDYHHPPPNYHHMKYKDRYAAERYGDRTDNRDGYILHERENGGPISRRPVLTGLPNHHSYESTFNRPFGPGSTNAVLDAAVRPHYQNIHPSLEYDAGSPSRPTLTRCEESDNFRQTAARHKMRRTFVRRALSVSSLIQCERECVENHDFVCRSFNYRDTTVSSYEEREIPNCELSDRDSRDLNVHDPSLFDAGNYDFYERITARTDGECMDVTQTCNEEGMKFTIRTPEGFVGRIYTYGYYDRCFFRGTGGYINVLRINGPQGYPDCGTQRFGDTLTNIVVVQFSDNVQTSRDKRYNLTCVFRGPGEAVVTSDYIGAGSGSPIPIEYLPAENTLSSKVRLMILYQGRPTTTIAVGDPLTFRLEAQDGYNYITDIFATNVIARDPYTGKSIPLIDRFGCPVDPYVFPELDKSRDGDMLEARFNAFKIPESNFLVFEATVRTCKEGCKPAYCPGPTGRQEPSFGRRRRRALYELKSKKTLEIKSGPENAIKQNMEINNSTVSHLNIDSKATATSVKNFQEMEEPEQVRKMIEVFETRGDIEMGSNPHKLMATQETICMTPPEYHGIITALTLLMILLFSITLVSGIAYRRYWKIVSKNRLVDRRSHLQFFDRKHSMTAGQFNEIKNAKMGVTDTTTDRNENDFRTNVAIFGGSWHKTFATGNLARICQLPIINTMDPAANCNQFDDLSEPIYTDPSLFERSRSLRSLAIQNMKESEQLNLD